MLAKLDDLTDEQFEELRDSVLTCIEEKDKNLKEEFDRFWAHEFVTHKYLFDRQKIECELLEELTQAEFTEHFKQMFGHSSAKRIDICFHSEAHKDHHIESQKSF